MLKRIFCACLCILLCLSAAGCCNRVTAEAADGKHPAYEAVPLTDEEKEILELMGSDVNVIAEEDYISMVAELIYHTDSFIGQVFQLEGVFTSDEEGMTVSRNLVNGEQTLVLGLPLQYLHKELVSGSWIRVTGIVSDVEVDGQCTTVLDVVAVEALEAFGNDSLPWDGSPIHHH